MTRRAERTPEAEQFGAAIRERRLAKGLTRQQLADMAGVSLRYVGAVEAGDNTPSIIAVFAFCEALGATPSALLDPIWRQRKR